MFSSLLKYFTTIQQLCILAPSLISSFHVFLIIYVNCYFQTLKKYGTEWIHEITDITPFVQQQYAHVKNKDLQKMVTPRERVYLDVDAETAKAIELDTEELVDMVV